MSLTPATVTLCALALLCTQHGAIAQLLPPIPPAVPPTVFTPPPAPPPIAPPPADAPRAPTIVARDASGALVMPTPTPEHAAVLGYPLEPDRKALVEKSLAARDRENERFVVDHIEAVRAAIIREAALQKMTSFAEMMPAKEAAQRVAREPLFDRLLRDGALTPMIRVRLDECVREFQTAQREEWKKTTGDDPMKIAQMVARNAFAEMTRESMAAHDRLIARLAPSLRDEVKSLPAPLALNPKQIESLDALKTPISTQAAREFLLGAVTVDQHTALLRRMLVAEVQN